MSPDNQLDLVKTALSEYTLPPNPLSLSTHYDLPDDLFHQYVSGSQDAIQPLHQLRPDTPNSAASTSSTGSTSSRTTIETEPGTVVGFQEILAKNKTAWIDPPSEKLKAKTAEELMKEIRWANLGWVYQVSMPGQIPMLTAVDDQSVRLCARGPHPISGRSQADLQRRRQPDPVGGRFWW